MSEVAKRAVVMVASVTVFFWVIKILTTAMGESAPRGGPRPSARRAKLPLVGVLAGCQRFLGLNAILAFWLAYIMTRPLGASFADWMGKSQHAGGSGSVTVRSHSFS